MRQPTPKDILWLLALVVGLVIFSVGIGLCAAYITAPDEFWSAIKSCCD